MRATDTTEPAYNRMIGHATAWQHALRLLLPQLPTSGTTEAKHEH